jgi:hypothetical protein
MHAFGEVMCVCRLHIYKCKYCYESRIRTICQLADGTSAFQDELPKGGSARRLTIALSEREVQPGLVHHSDRGVQYAAGGSTQEVY